MKFPKRGEVLVEGTVSAGFEPLRLLFTENMRRQAEVNAQLCIYVGEDCVVDLYGTAVGDKDYSGETLANVFSSGKSLEAIALASLVSSQRLDYKAKICEHWPEFSGDGKENLTIADLMRHEAGLSSLNVSIDPRDLWRDNIKANKIGEVLESHPLRFRQDTPREYHAMTRGWVANEVFRRVDPFGRTIGEFLCEDLCPRLEADVHVGLSDEQLTLRSPVIDLDVRAHLLQSLLPKVMGRKVKHNIFELGRNILPLVKSMRKSSTPVSIGSLFGGRRRRWTRGSPPPLIGMDEIGFFNHPSVAKGETPSANTHGTARGLARIAGMMACGGEWGGKRYLSEKAWSDMHAEPVYRSMGMEVTFTQGGVAQFGPACHASTPIARSLNKGREGFYGWMGLGGSIFQWHPEKRIGFSFVPTALHVLDFVNERGKAFQAAALRCL